MSSEEPRHYLAERVRDALAHDARVNEITLQVKIVGDRVYVTGQVSTPERRDAIADVVRGVLPEMDVVNDTTTVRLDRVEEAEDLRR